MRQYLLWIILIAVRWKEIDTSKSEIKAKRQINSLPLVFPYGATYKLLMGFASPIHNDDNINLVFAANFQYQYLHFQNISELSRYYFINTVSREQREAEYASRKDERLIFYTALEQMLDSKGFAGRDCLLRAICEAAQYPVEDQGLVGEILHIILTPNYGRSLFEDTDVEWHDMMSDYLSAQTAGEQMFLCSYIYKNCPEGQGVLELISQLQND